MSKIICKCGNILADNTDGISYKGYILSDKQSHPFLDFADEMIASSDFDREKIAMTFRYNIIGDRYIKLKTIFQCPECGRVLIENNSGEFCVFSPESHDNTQLLNIDAGKIKLI